MDSVLIVFLLWQSAFVEGRIRLLIPSRSTESVAGVSLISHAVRTRLSSALAVAAVAALAFTVDARAVATGFPANAKADYLLGVRRDVVGRAA